MKFLCLPGAYGSAKVRFAHDIQHRPREVTRKLLISIARSRLDLSSPAR